MMTFLQRLEQIRENWPEYLPDMDFLYAMKKTFYDMFEEFFYYSIYLGLIPSATILAVVLILRKMIDYISDHHYSFFIKDDLKRGTKLDLNDRLKNEKLVPLPYKFYHRIYGDESILPQRKEDYMTRFQNMSVEDKAKEKTLECQADKGNMLWVSAQERAYYEMLEELEEEERRELRKNEDPYVYTGDLIKKKSFLQLKLQLQRRGKMTRMTREKYGVENATYSDDFIYETCEIIPDRTWHRKSRLSKEFSCIISLFRKDTEYRI
uniref:Uncharacterized protein n=1 Tax=Pleurostomum flabellatum TaxID=405751 RepID=A0A7T0M418_9EUKA|nr:hypothetical protein J6731_mgp53 [Pleurostomum flabellatum]QPL15608.1 hypothetical protein [Pleurostomum flabellatum]